MMIVLRVICNLELDVHIASISDQLINLLLTRAGKKRPLLLHLAETPLKNRKCSVFATLIFLWTFFSGQEWLLIWGIWFAVCI